MKNYKWLIILANLVLVLSAFHYSLFQKEELLSDGQLILLELAPVDPRSLMQGDFMRLRYDISNNISPDSLPKIGFCVVTLTEGNVAKRVRFQSKTTPLKEGEFLIEYASQDWRGINIGAESYFFQEGEGEKYEIAKYGGLKVDGVGNSVLIGLYDEKKRKIE